MSRRTAVISAFAGVGTLLSRQTVKAGAKRGVPRVDTHLHCFAGNSQSRFPYHQRAPYRPEAEASPEHLLHCMDGAGVQYAVVVHPEPYQDDHRYLRHCLKLGQGRLKGTSLVFADRPNAVKKLKEIAGDGGIVATRIHAYAPDRLPPFGRPEFRDLWVAASDLGLAVQLHFEPRYAPGFEAYIREFRETTVIIDHLGRPFQGTPEDHDVVVKWSRFPNTIMKLSAIPTTRSYPHREIAPIISQLVKNFGSDRMIYGGGFGATASPSSYRASFERARSFLGEFTAAEQENILGGNAAKLFGWGI